MTIPKLKLNTWDLKKLVSQMIERVRAVSGNTLSDFSPSSPVTAILEGEAYAVKELLYYMDLLPEATALEVLRIAGVSRHMGGYAEGPFEFILDRQLSSPYFLPTGFSIPGVSNQYWVLQEDLYILPGGTRGTVRVKSSLPGKAYNRDPFALNITQTSLSYVASIRNPEAIAGGTEIESIASLLDRAHRELRYRGTLVSVSDYELRAQEYLGEGSRAYCIPLLGANRSTEAVGNVHIFLIGADGRPPSVTVCQDIQVKMKEDSYAAANVWVSPVEPYQVALDVTLDVLTLSKSLIGVISQAAKDYLHPSTFTMGKTVLLKELEYHFRRQSGVTGVSTVLINGRADNLGLPLRWSLPYLGTLRLTQTDPEGRYLNETVYFGPSDPD